MTHLYLPDFREAAESLARTIWERRVFSTDGSATWLLPRDIRVTSKRISVGPYLYDGAAGIALFFAALARVTGDAIHRERSLQALSPIRKHFAALVSSPDRADRLVRLGIGGLQGIGSIVYAFSQIGTLLGDPSLIREALSITKLITVDRIHRDESLDIIFGSAGTILALLTLGQLLPAESLSCREIASSCAEVLLAKRADSKGWRTLRGHPPLSGFSHGAAGICYALLRLYGMTHEQRLLAAAHDGLEFEHTTFSPRYGNWRDLRCIEKLHFENSWCHGAPGIALARLGSLQVLDEPRLRDELSIGIATTRACPLVLLDHICCGNMGRVDILLEASIQTGNEDLRKDAAAIALQILHRGQPRHDYFYRDGKIGDPYDSSFFTGAAGIGYVFLRLVEPSELPCVLLLG